MVQSEHELQSKIWPAISYQAALQVPLGSMVSQNVMLCPIVPHACEVHVGVPASNTGASGGPTSAGGPASMTVGPHALYASCAHADVSLHDAHEKICWPTW